MAYLTRDAILSAQDLVTEDVAVPEWGGTVRVRGLTGTERDEIEASMVEQRGRKVHMNMANLRARLCAMSIVDEDGRRLFATVDVKVLGEKSAAALDRVFSVAQRLSGFSKDDIEELTKNSESAPSGASTSD